jgi:hypothetical protein
MAKVVITIEDQEGENDIHIATDFDPPLQGDAPLSDAQLFGMKMLNALAQYEKD